MRNSRDSKTIGSMYTTVVLLDYIRTYCAGVPLYLPEYLNRELGIVDAYTTANSLVRQHLLERQEEGVVRLTEAGLALLQEQETYVRFFRCASPYVTILDYEAQAKEMDAGTPFPAVMTALLEAQLLQRREQGDFEAVKNLHFDIAAICEEAGEDDRAVRHYVTALYYETSGVEYRERFQMLANRQKTARELEQLYSYTCIDPQIVAGIKRLQAAYTAEMADAVFTDDPLSINLCPREQFRALITDILQDTFDNREWQIFFWRAYKERIASTGKV